MNLRSQGNKMKYAKSDRPLPGMKCYTISRAKEEKETAIKIDI